MAQLCLENEQYQRVVEAVNTRADQIDENTTELQALFDIRQAFGPEPEANTGKEVVDITFSKVSVDEAKAELRKSKDSLNTAHEETLYWLAEQL